MIIEQNVPTSIRNWGYCLARRDRPRVETRRYEAVISCLRTGNHFSLGTYGIYKCLVGRHVPLIISVLQLLFGAIPLLALFNFKDIAARRGQWLDYGGIPVMPTYHPAYLLLNKLAKKDAWADLQAVMAFFGRKPKPRQ